MKSGMVSGLDDVGLGVRTLIAGQVDAQRSVGVVEFVVIRRAELHRSTVRGENLDASSFSAALTRLSERGVAPAAAILDGVITSDRIADLDAMDYGALAA